MRILFGILMILSFSKSVLAYEPEQGKVTAIFGPYIYKTAFHGGQNGLVSPTKADLGLVVNGDLDGQGSLEATLFHMNKTYFRDQSSQFISEEAQLVQVSLGYRRWFSHYFSGALDLYSNYTLGEAKMRHDEFQPGTEIQTTAHDYTEYGLQASLQWEIWSQGKSSVILDGRYSFSLTHKSHEHADQYGTLIGFKYQLQGKDPTPSAPSPPTPAAKPLTAPPAPAPPSPDAPNPEP